MDYELLNEILDNDYREIQEELDSMNADAMAEEDAYEQQKIALWTADWHDE